MRILLSNGPELQVDKPFESSLIKTLSDWFESDRYTHVVIHPGGVCRGIAV
jgi:hypothetical protein